MRVKPEPAAHIANKMETTAVACSRSEPSKKTRHTIAIRIALLIGLGLLATWPLLILGAPDLSHDGVDHARWAKHFAAQFWQGDLYPRWYTNVSGGFGGPSGFFYPPLTNYASALFWPLVSARDPYGWRVAGFALAMAQILSGITAYWWLRSLTRPGAALLGAAVYAIAPYHLALDAYLRGASAEDWVFVWFPLVLLSAEGMLQHSRWAFAGAAASYALAVLSHPTVSLCFALVPLAYVFFLSESKARIRTTAMMAAALLLGVGLNAQFLLPAIFDQDKAYVAWQTIGHGDYHSQWLWQDGHELAEMARYMYGKATGAAPQIYWETLLKMPFLLTTLATSIAVAGLFLVVRWCEKADRLRRIAVFYGVVALVSVFLMTRFSSFLWQTAPFLKFLQYPFRMNAMLVLSVTILAALAAPCLLLKRARTMTLLLCAVLLGSLGLDAAAAAQAFSAWRRIPPERVPYLRQLVRTQIDYSTMWPRPGNVAALSDFTAFDVFVMTHPPKTGKLETQSTGKTVGAVRVASWQPRRVALEIDAPHESRLTLNHFYYAGWQGRMDNGTVLPARPSPDGLMQFEVPEGKYEMVVELPKDRAEMTGTAISLFSLGLLCAAAIWPGRGVRSWNR